MVLALHHLEPSKGSRKKRKRVGRGNSSGHGTYSTRGLKGQKARSGGKKGLRIKGMRNVILNLPKKKGFKSIYPKNEVVNLKELTRVFEDGAKITPGALLNKGLVDNIKAGVKILGEGKIDKKFYISGCLFSKKAKIAVNKAGGNIDNIKPNKTNKKRASLMQNNKKVILGEK